MKLLPFPLVLLLAWPTSGDLDKALTDRDFGAVDRIVQDLTHDGLAAGALPVIRTRLRHADADVRRLAAYALSQLDPDAAKQEIAALVEALQDREPRVRARVALALGQMGPTAREAVAALKEQLHDSSPRARAGAARALGLIGADARATIPGLIKLLNDSEAPVRGTAAAALGQLGPLAVAAATRLAVVQASDNDAEVRAAAGAALEEIAPSLPVVRAALSAAESNRRLWAVSVLASKGPSASGAVGDLIDLLKREETAAVRAGAALALGKIGSDARAICPILIEALKDSTARVRTAAALALGLLGAKAQGAGEPLAVALRDEDAEVAASAATALGNLGPQVDPAVPLLIDMLKQPDATQRRRAANVLARIGAPARAARGELVEALKSGDSVVRADAALALVSVGPQANAPLPALIEALHSSNVHVRAWAGLSLAQVGPAARDAIQPLVAALQDEEPSVCIAATLALGRIGPPSMPALVKALDHLDPRVRQAAAHALGAIGAGSKRALPRLRDALRDEDASAAQAAAWAIAQIAQGLQLAQEANSLAELEQALKAMDEVQPDRASTDQQAQWSQAMAQVRTTIHGLQTVRKASLLDRFFAQPWLLGLVGALLAVSVLVGLWSILLRWRPLVLLRCNDILIPLSSLRLPTSLGGMEISLRGLLLLRPFLYHRRVLDAWVARHVEAIRNNFEIRPTVKDRRVYVPAPVVLDGVVVPGLLPAQLREAFARDRTCLLIWGEGGCGKTTLACQVARWAAAADSTERLAGHLMLPVLIEHELDVQAADGKPAFTALTEAVRGQLQTQIGAAHDVPAELLDHLLRRRRILVVVDRVSEVSPAARAAIRPAHPDFPAHALVVTSRVDEALDGVPRSVMQPGRIEANHLTAFLQAYLEQRGKRQSLDDAEFFEAGRRLRLLAGGCAITALLARQLADRLVDDLLDRAA